MNPSPAGLAPVEGIPMRAQAILHREILHVHGLLTLTTLLLRTRLAILSPTFLDCITSPHLQVQIRGLDSSIRQATQAIHTGLHYIQELLTTFGTFGLIHALTYDTAQLDAELRGRTTFRDPRLPSTPPSGPGSSSTRRSTPTNLHPDDTHSRLTRTSSTSRPTHGIVVTTSNRTLSTAELWPTMNRSRSRSRPRSNSRHT